MSGILIEMVKRSEIDTLCKTRLKNVIVAVSFILNLAILFYFKYFNFIIGIIGKVASKMHIYLDIPLFDIILPVGISFYTFQALGYTMDVYRNEINAEKNFFKYALFVSFFPQLVAGPIERSKKLLNQLAVPQKFNFENAREGLLLMLWGFFLKIVLADRIAIFVDTIYGDCKTYAGSYLILATIFFAVQIYCDFSGYSAIAMGVAKFIGIELMENFDAPYYSVSVADFWRKWHISLTSWFKDYLYIPLGGSRNGKVKGYLNKMIVFLISGLWHGASFSFIAWGALNGLYQIIGDILRPIRDMLIEKICLNRESFGHKLIQVIGTFILIDFSWIFFRANSFMGAFEIIKQMFSVRNVWILFDGSIYYCGLDVKNFWLMIICIGILGFADYCKHKNIKIREVIISQDYWFRCCFVAVSIGVIMLFGIWGPAFDKSNFIYFQF